MPDVELPASAAHGARDTEPFHVNGRTYVAVVYPRQRVGALGWRTVVVQRVMYSVPYVDGGGRRRSGMREKIVGYLAWHDDDRLESIAEADGQTIDAVHATVVTGVRAALRRAGM